MSNRKLPHCEPSRRPSTPAELLALRIALMIGDEPVTDIRAGLRLVERFLQDLEPNQHLAGRREPDRH